MHAQEREWSTCLRVETKDIELRKLWVEARGGQLLSIANISKIETMSMVSHTLSGNG